VEWVDTGTAAARLGVQPRTLYAYVSRGLLRRRVGPDGRRSEYHAGDLATLAVRGRRARPVRPSDIVVPSAITRIGAEGPAYRGQLAVELAGRWSFEDVAALLWSDPDAAAGAPAEGSATGLGPRPGIVWGIDDDRLAVVRSIVAALPDGASPAARIAPAITAMRAADPLGRDTDPVLVRGTGAALLLCLVTVCGDHEAVAGSCAARIVTGLTGAADATATALVDAALVLLADHELAASTLAVRVAASARADPYAAVLAGAAVLSGRRHGGAGETLERAFAEVREGAEPAGALARTRADGVIPGFGHPLYPDGDPRAARLLELLRAGPLAGRSEPVERVLRAAEVRGLAPPSVDAALAAVTHAIGARPGAAEYVFTLARLAGAVAHALEQYQQPELLRPRAVAIGP
jgi:citrate synthase